MVDENENTQNIEERIHGGNEITIAKTPHVASLRFEGVHQCVASILTATKALIAGHCLKKGHTHVGYNIMAASTTIEGDADAQYRDLVQFFRHPEFDLIAHMMLPS